MRFIQPQSGLELTFAITPMPDGHRWWWCRYVNGHPQTRWNGWPISTCAKLLCEAIDVERHIGSKELR